MEQRSHRTASGRVAAAAAALVIGSALGSLAGCGHHAASPPPSSPLPSPSQTAVVAPPMKVSFRSVSGRLPKAQRRHLSQQLTSIVERWWAAAYLNDRSSKSFPVFTPAAAKLAERQAALTTSSLPQGTPIAVVRRTLAIDVLAVHKKPVGADAVIELTYAAGSGGHAPRYRVEGTISLTPTKKGWRVFAFDLTKAKAKDGGGR